MNEFMPFVFAAPFGAVVSRYSVPIRPLFWAVAALLFGLTGTALRMDGLGWFSLSNDVAEAVAGLILGLMLVRTITGRSGPLR